MIHQKKFDLDENHYIWSTSIYVRLRDWKFDLYDIFIVLITCISVCERPCDWLHVSVSVRDHAIDYMIETTCIYICEILFFVMLDFMRLLSCQLV